ncbi:hypothetical protein [Alteromonas aestuariivivens]|nr:hypothetical protein [Alteromonas aestuariivivens]
MKINEHKTLLAFTSMGIFCSMLMGCDTELDQAGIVTGTNTNIQPIIYQDGYGFIRKAREGENGIEYYYQRSDVDADFQTKMRSGGIYGMSEDAKVPVSIVSVMDISGTVYDPRVAKSIEQTLDSCDARNDNTAAANLTAQNNWQAEKEDAEKNGRPVPAQPEDAPLEPCDDEAYIYELMSFTPVPLEDAIDVTSEGLFKYELDKTLDVDLQQYFGMEAALTAEPGTLTYFTNITPTFDLTDDHWEKAYQAVLQVGNHTDEFIVNTGVRDGQLDLKTNFLTSKRNLKPGRYFDMAPITFGGYNTNAPVVITKGDYQDFDILYAINTTDDEDYQSYIPGETSLTVREGQKLYLRIQSKDGEDTALYYDKELEIHVTVGEQGTEQLFDSAVVHTQPIDYLPGPELAWDYPVSNSATLKNTVLLRGSVEITQDQLDFSNNGKVDDATIPDEYQVEKIEVYSIDPITGNEVLVAVLDQTQFELDAEASEMVTSAISEELVKRNVYQWQFEAPLNAGENEFLVKAYSNLKRGETQVAESEPSVTEILRVEDNIDVFPSHMTTSVLEHIADLTWDPRDNALFLLDRSSNNDDITGNQAPGIIWRYPLSGKDKPVCLTLPWSWQDAGVNGIQFNHAIPEIGGVVVSSSPGNLAYYSDDDLDGDVSYSNKGQFQTNWEGTKQPGHMAYTANGQTFFMSSKSNFNQQKEYQAIVGMKTPKIEDFVFKGFGSGIGVVAKETSAAEDAQNLNNNAVSLDILSVPNTDPASEAQYEEYVLVLDGKDNTTMGNNGLTNLRKMPVSESYSPETSHSIVNLVDEFGDAVKLYQADAIAVSSERRKAYVADNQNKLIYEIDLSEIATSDTLVAKVVASPAQENQPPIGDVKSMVIEGGMDYMIISDIANKPGYSALLAFDLETYDMAYIIKTNNQIVGDPELSHCDQ